MKFRFLHIADCHLGYRQYNLRERINDFARAFYHVIDIAIQEQVNFVILAGDLFQKRTIDALTLGQAMRGLERLANANIPCIAVEGNHEHAYYGERFSWMEFLAQRNLLHLLNTRMEEGKAVVEAYVKREGSYIEPLPGVRVHGMRYYGAATPQAFKLYAEALATAELPRVDYSIVVAHAGMEGVLPEQGGLSHREVGVLRDHTDYLALGHIHKPYEFDNWIYNPGSLENCSLTEADWPDRGYFLVDVDTARSGIKHEAVLKANPRRPIHRLALKTDLYTAPDMLMERCGEYLRRKARDVGAKRTTDETRPIVELQLTGVLPFDRAGLDVSALEEMVREEFLPLHVFIRNMTRATAFEISAEEGVSRRVLERQILTELFGQDSEFSRHSQEWAGTALALKSLALEGASADAILQDLADRMTRMDGGIDEVGIDEVGSDEATSDETANAGAPNAETADYDTASNDRPDSHAAENLVSGQQESNSPDNASRDNNRSETT